MRTDHHERHRHLGTATAAAWASARRRVGSPPRGDIRTALLAVLAEGPGHGYDLISRLEDKSGGSGARAPDRCTRPSSSSRTRAWPRRRRPTASGSTRSPRGRRRGHRRVAEAGAEPWAAGVQTVACTPVTCSARSEHSARRPDRSSTPATPEQLAKVVDIVDNARREVYRLLADEPDRHRLSPVPPNRMGVFRGTVPSRNTHRSLPPAGRSVPPPMTRFYATTPIYYVNDEPAHRARLHDDRRRRA